MIAHRATQKGASKPGALRMIAVGTAMALVVSVAVVVVSQWLGHPAHPALGAAMGVVAAASYGATLKRQTPGTAHTPRDPGRHKQPR